MSGDVGAVGRISISNTQNGSPEMLLDLKGNYCCGLYASFIKKFY